MNNNLIINGLVFKGGRFVKKSIIVQDNKIIKIHEGHKVLKNFKVINLPKNLVITQGFVDAHVHCRDFELSYKEDLETCSRSALTGGVIAVGDMPNTKPKINNIDIVIKRLEKASRLGIIYKLHMGVPGDLKELKKALELGVNTVKIYPEDWVEYGRRHIVELFKTAKELGLTLVFHCEDEELINHTELDFNKHNVIRCKEVEISSVLEVLNLSLKYGSKTHLTHISTPESVELVNNVKNITNITIDTTPHHIILDQEECLSRVEIPGLCKVNPPLRSQVDRMKLLKQLASNKIDMIVSDHAPHTINEKSRNYLECTSGFPGLETTLPILLTLWKNSILSFNQIMNLFSKKPAKLLNINIELTQGSDANLVIIDLNREYAIDGEKFKSKAKFSPFSGFRVKGLVVATMVRGEFNYIHDDYTHIFT